MRRKDSFFGLHFDYHANKDTKDAGKYLDEKVIERIVTEVKPDFIQCDTKGHPGNSSYRTEVGTPAPRPNKTVLQPENKEIPFRYENGEVIITLDKVEIYNIIEVK